MKKPLPPSISGLLDGAALPPPVEPVLPIGIPTAPPAAREAYRLARRTLRRERGNREAIARGLDIDLPF